MRRRMRFLSSLLAILLASAVALPSAFAAPVVEPLRSDDCGLAAHWATSFACNLIDQEILEIDAEDRSQVNLDEVWPGSAFETLLYRAMGWERTGGDSDAPITRRDAITILAKVVGQQQLAKADLRVLEGYEEAAEAGEATRQALAFLLVHGVIQGSAPGVLDLDRPLTLGEAAKLINLSVPERLPEGTDKISLLLFNDFHGRLYQDGKQRAGYELGIERLSTAIAGQLLKNPLTVLIDGGDTFQGTPISNLANGESTQEWRNKVGVNISTLGNHEFDWNLPFLHNLLDKAEHPVVSANIFLEGTDQRPDWVKPSTILTVGGYKIGFIGITTPSTKSIVLPANIAGLDFTDPVPVINAEAKKLRADGADLVVVINHASASPSEADPFQIENEVADWMKQVTERIDAVTGAHSHERAAGYLLDGNGTKVPVIQARSYGQALGRIDLYMNQADKQVTRAVPAVWEPSQMLAPTPWATDLITKWAEAIKPIESRPVGRLTAPISRDYSPAGESALGDFITDGMRAAAPGIQIAVTNGGGIRAHLEADPETGEVTWGQIFTTTPFGNTLVAVEMTGAELKTLLEQGLIYYVKSLTNQPGGHRPLQVSGITYIWDFAKPDNERIDPADLKLEDGTPVDMEATYKVVVNNFMAGGGDDLVILKELQAKQLDLGIVDVDAFVDYFKAQAGGEPLSFEIQNRVQVKNFPAE